jgi:hypothetical protein
MFLIDVKSVKPLDNRRVELSFEDGLVATINLDDVIKSYDGVFAPLTDPLFFRKVSVNVELGTIFWPNGADICPDVLYANASGKNIPEK